MSPRLAVLARSARSALILIAALLLASVASCGDDHDAPTSFAIATQALTHPVLTEDGTPGPTRQRQITFHVRPRCTGESDCRGTYTLFAKYRFRPGHPGSIGCVDPEPGLGYSKPGLFDVAPTGPLQALNCFADTDVGRVKIDGSLHLASSDDPPTESIGVTMGITGDLGDRLLYRWTGRDGAHCAGEFSAKTNAVQRFTCPTK